MMFETSLYSVIEYRAKVTRKNFHEVCALFFVIDFLQFKEILMTICKVKQKLEKAVGKLKKCILKQANC